MTVVIRPKHTRKESESKSLSKASRYSSYRKEGEITIPHEPSFGIQGASQHAPIAHSSEHPIDKYKESKTNIKAPDFNQEIQRPIKPNKKKGTTTPGKTQSLLRKAAKKKQKK